MAIIDQYDKRSGVTYVYESKSEWVPELKQSRAKRRLIGRRDPDTGEIHPTQRRRIKDSDESDSEQKHSDEYQKKLQALLSEQRITADELSKIVKKLNKINSELDKLLRSECL